MTGDVSTFLEITEAENRFYLFLWLFSALLLLLFVVAGRLLKFKVKTASHPQGAARFIHWLPPLNVTLVIAAVLRVPRFFTSFWYDETFTGVMAGLPLQDFFPALLGDVHPPGYYLIAKVSSVLLGRHEFALRLPSLIAGLLVIWVVYRLSERLFSSPEAARLAAILVAIMPGMIHYSAEARYPMLLALAVLGGWLAYLEGRPFWVAVAGVGAAYLHAIGLIYAGVLAWLALWRWLTGGRSWHWFNAGVLIVAASAVWGIIALIQAGDVNDGFWLWQMLPVKHIITVTVGDPVKFWLLPGVIIMIILSLLGGRVMLKQAAARQGFLLLGIATPLLVTLVGLWRPIYIPHALLASGLVLIPGFAFVLWKSPWFMLALVVIPISLGHYYAYQLSLSPKSLDTIFGTCADYDLVYTTSLNMAIVSRWYYPENSFTTATPGNHHQYLSPEAMDAMGIRVLDPESLEEMEVFCVVVQWSLYTTEGEAALIQDLKQLNHSGERIEVDGFTSYEILKIGG